MNEADWIRRAKKGDTQAFENLVHAKREQVYWLAYRIIGNREDARDIAQLVFIKLWRVIGKYSKRYSFDTWLYRIVTNMSIDYYRKETTKARLRSSIDDDNAGIVLKSHGRQERDYQLGEISRIFDELAAGLSPRQRAAFVLKEIENKTTPEIARIMRLSQSTVRNHLFQARKMLQEELKKRYPEYIPGGSS